MHLFLVSDEDGDGSTAIIILSVLSVILFAVVMFLLLRKQIKPYLWSSNLVVITMVLSGKLNHNYSKIKLLALFMAKTKGADAYCFIIIDIIIYLPYCCFKHTTFFPLKHKRRPFWPYSESQLCLDLINFNCINKTFFFE